MKIRILGTAAAEGIPGMFCVCDTCQKTRAAGGRNLRTRSQAIVDDALLIDFGPDTLAHTLNGSLQLHKVEHMLITHAHCDHLHVDGLENRMEGYCTIPDKKPMHVYATARSLELMRERCERTPKIYDAFCFHEVKPFEPFKAGEYDVTPLRADHDATTDPVIYLITQNGKTFFYATDTGYFTEDTLAYLKENVSHIDAIALDCTAMLLPGWKHSHLGLDTCAELAEHLKALGVINDETKIYMHHFSHNGGATHDEFVPLAEKHGFGVTYDSMEIEI